ncbi:diguanylate cyclase [Sphingobium chlorophenolicum L-1]|uniref:diguanylate cyclase n=1 Tax=Sphingobium chlorophenolicum L-1 TaxID=690566 RepID=F6ETA8_SPHCR|nr:GGDEF domain-containing protein [Sphingobium chlorophenolicum]AEG47745.1 diguanylate cyclase [Sphingobium chlorophenolicum L-1]
MQFYLATSFIFPRSLRFRLFALCFATTHLPLLGYIGWGVATGRFAWAEFIVLTLATMAGAAGALLGIGALLNPIHALADALHPAEEKERKRASPTLPEASDIIARLFSGVRRAATATQTQIDALNAAAHEDALTGIANRRGFLAQIDTLPVTRRRGCIAIIDIDHFKQVNDQLGHEAGDRLLADFAARLSSQTRRIDIVGRWGGEEFAIFYQDAIEDEASWSLARIAERMRQEPVGAVHGQPVTFSAGLCAWRGGPVTDAIDMADDALYHAKRSGRDRIQRAARPSASAYG